jgi:hypothetical protein
VVKFGLDFRKPNIDCFAASSGYGAVYALMYMVEMEITLILDMK